MGSTCWSKAREWMPNHTFRPPLPLSPLTPTAMAPDGPTGCLGWGAHSQPGGVAANWTLWWGVASPNPPPSPSAANLIIALVIHARPLGHINPPA